MKAGFLVGQQFCQPGSVAQKEGQAEGGRGADWGWGEEAACPQGGGAGDGGSRTSQEGQCQWRQGRLLVCECAWHGLHTWNKSVLQPRAWACQL